MEKPEWSIYLGESVVEKWFLLALIGLQGCQSWQHQTDVTDRVDRHSHDAALHRNDDPGSNEELQASVAFGRLRLDILQLQGAGHCLPDQLKQASLLMGRAQTSLDNSHSYHVKEELRNAFRELDLLHDRLTYIRERVSCSKPHSSPLFANGFDLHLGKTTSLRAEGVSAFSSTRTETFLNCNARFAFDSAFVTPAYAQHLQHLARELSPHTAWSVRIAGHTDSEGSDSYNVVLAEKRAKAVRDVLTESGVSREATSIVAFGERQPLFSNATPEGRFSNRRVEISLRDSSIKGYPAKANDERLDLLWEWQPSSRIQRASE